MKLITQEDYSAIHSRLENEEITYDYMLELLNIAANKRLIELLSNVEDKAFVYTHSEVYGSRWMREKIISMCDETINPSIENYLKGVTE